MCRRASRIGYRGHLGNVRWSYVRYTPPGVDLGNYYPLRLDHHVGCHGAIQGIVWAKAQIGESLTGRDKLIPAGVFKSGKRYTDYSMSINIFCIYTYTGGEIAFYGLGWDSKKAHIREVAGSSWVGSTPPIHPATPPGQA